MFNNVHVLIIDDNYEDADILSEILGTLNVTHDVISNTSLIRTELDLVQVPSVVFLDLELPGTTGFEVLDLIRSHPRLADVPVVAYSSHSTEKPSVRKSDFSGFLGKPINAPRVEEFLQRVLDGEKVWDLW
jgi:CheY-like chemotaxis protein